MPTNPVTNNMEANVMNVPNKALLYSLDNNTAIFVGLIIIAIPTNNIVTNITNEMTSLSTLVPLSSVF